MQWLFVEQLGTGPHESMTPRKIGGRCGGVRSRGARGAGRCVPGAADGLTVELPQVKQRTLRVYAGLVQDECALGIVPSTPGVHQYGYGMAGGDDVEE